MSDQENSSWLTVSYKIVKNLSLCYKKSYFFNMVKPIDPIFFKMIEIIEQNFFNRVLHRCPGLNQSAQPWFMVWNRVICCKYST